MVSRGSLIALVVACREPAKELPPPPPPPLLVADAAIDAPIDAPIDAVVDAPLDAAEPRPAWLSSAPTTIDGKIALWWNEIANGQTPTHFGEPFVVEGIVAPALFAGLDCTIPYVTDQPRLNDECLQRLVVNSPPPRWQDGWGCKGFSGSDLAKSIQRTRVASKNRLRCGNRSNAGVFVAVDADGNVSGFLVNQLDSR